MPRTRSLSSQTTVVLCALAADPAAWRGGYELCLVTGLKAGLLYPILLGLADQGVLEARCESRPPPGRPARHLHQLTAAGQDVAAQPSGRTARAGVPNPLLGGA